MRTTCDKGRGRSSSCGRDPLPRWGLSCLLFAHPVTGDSRWLAARARASPPACRVVSLPTVLLRPPPLPGRRHCCCCLGSEALLLIKRGSPESCAPALDTRSVLQVF